MLFRLMSRGRLWSRRHLTIGSAARPNFTRAILSLSLRQQLRAQADDILAGRRSSDLGQSFDAQAISYGRKPIGGLKKAS